MSDIDGNNPTPHPCPRLRVPKVTVTVKKKQAKVTACHYLTLILTEFSTNL